MQFCYQALIKPVLSIEQKHTSIVSSNKFMDGFLHWYNDGHKIVNLLMAFIILLWHLGFLALKGAVYLLYTL